MSKSTVQQAVKPKSPTSVPAADAARQAKLQERRIKWQWNGRLLTISLVTVAVIGLASVASYWFFSASIAETFRDRAAVAETDGDYNSQLKWLRRYSLMEPEDKGVILEMANAAENAADNAPSDKLDKALNNARKQLGAAIASLDPNSPDLLDLRYRLIQRHLQLGGAWFRDAENQVCISGVPYGDPKASKLLAMSLVGQVNAGTYVPRTPDEEKRKRMNEWQLLAVEPVGDVLLFAAEAMPGDLDCIAAIVAALDREPDYFSLNAVIEESNVPAIDDSDDEESEIEVSPALVEKVRDVLVSLRGNEDSRAQLILYRFDGQFGDGAEAEANLKVAAFRAFEQLMELDDKAAAAEDRMNGRYAYVPDYYWNYQLLLESAKTFAGSETANVGLWYDRLMELKLPGIPKRRLEQAYLGAGLLEEAKGNRELAIEIWEEGLSTINAASLDLLVAIARVRQADDLATSEESVENLEKAIQVQTRLLSLANEREMPRERQIELRRKLKAAEWRWLVLNSTLQERKGNRRAAIKDLTVAMKGAEEISKNEWLAAVMNLGRLYRSEAELDQSARAFQFATEIEPGQPELRVISARAWALAGNRLESIKQWRMVAATSEPDLQVAAVEALFNYQLRLPTAERDFSGVRSSIRRLEKAVAEKLKTDPSYAEVQSQLMLVSISLPPEGVSVEDHLQSEQLANAVDELALRNPNDAAIQQFAAERLAASGQDERSKLAMQRLEEAATDNLTSVEIVRARLESGAGQHEAAAQRLIDRAEADEDRRAELLELACNYAIQGNLIELAYRSIESISPKSAGIYYRLATLARALPENSELLGKDAQSTPLGMSIYWEEELDDIEGDTGVFSQYLNATRLFDEIESDPIPLERNDSRLRELKRLANEIESLRPRWGQGISLRGLIYALEKDPENAILSFRRGMAAGDNAIQTRQRLWGQLILVGKFDEAEAELDTTAKSTGIDVDKYGKIKIGLAQRKGEFERGVEVAEAEVENRPKDFLSYLVLAGAASAAAKEVDDEDKKSGYIEQARNAVRTAEELAEGDQPGVYFASLLIEIAHGGDEGIRSEIKRIEESELPELDRYGLMSQAYNALSEFEQALEAIEKVDRIRPTAETKLAIAELSRRLRDSGREVDALREAVKKNPKDGRLRNRLAQALVARDGENIDWNVVTELLTDSEDATWGNRFLYSLLLLKQEDPQRALRAEQILREIYREQNRFSSDAGRVLAGLLEQNATKAEGKDELRQRYLAEARDIYEGLVRSRNAPVSDIYRFAYFLIRLDNDGDWPRIRGLYERLNVHPQGTLAAFEIKIKLDTKDGKDPIDTVESFVKSREKELGKSTVASIAGTYLMKFGLERDGLKWLQQAYETDPTKLAAYIGSMDAAGMFDKSASVSAKHFADTGEVQAAILLVETLFKASSVEMTNKYEKVIASALAMHGGHAPLLESLATLRLRNQEYLDAIAMYNRVLEIDSGRLLTLNNLAMAFTELPGRAGEGLDPIDRAIDLAGELPELLDTKGVVLLKAGRPADAEDVFKQALTATKESRFEFHLIMTLLAQNKQSDARRRWSKLDLEKLDVDGLVESERVLLEELKVKFGTGTL